MKRDFAARLACPTCRTSLSLGEEEGDDAHVHRGNLTCDRCWIVVPVAQGFPFFTQADIVARDVSPLLGTRAEYDAYHRRKFERGDLEIYAAFQPFNESMRAAEPVLAAFGAKLKPGDIILDPWARTGWAAATLAAQFPEQTIVALWEGDSSVLGYKGFARWFAEEKRPTNLEILFVHPDSGLPFPDESIGGVFSHDCFHRFGIDRFGSELLRVARPDAPIVLAHTHLSNSDPDPWFDRGGVIRHGQEYRAWLDRICGHTARQGWIWSEGDLFGAGELPPDSPSTSHYNALIFIADPGDLNRPARPRTDEDAVLLLNPLYRLHPGRRSARVERAHLDGLVGHMLDRHPVYLPRLAGGMIELEDRDWLIVMLAACGARIAELESETGLPAPELRRRLRYLQTADLVLPVQAGASMIELQRFHSNQLPPTGTFSDLTEFCGKAKLTGPDGFEIEGPEIVDAIGHVAGALRQMGVGQDARVSIGAAPHPLALISLLGALSAGANVDLSGPAGALRVCVTGQDQTIPFGLSGEEGGLVDGLESAERLSLALIRDDQRIYLEQSDGSNIRVSRLLEAVYSLRHSVGNVDHVESVISFADLFAVLVSIAKGLPVTIS